MNKKFAFLFPGQGAQYPGMAKDFNEQFSIARETFEEADEVLSQRFSDIIFNASNADLTLTKNSQLAIYIASMAIWRTVQQQFPQLQPFVCAGLSLGEYSALTAAEKIHFADGLKLVQARANYMNDACNSSPGTMKVVLGLDSALVEECIRQINPPRSVWVANLNCPGQVVIAGTAADLENAVGILKDKGAKRVLPLDVSGAFHSGLMEEAQNRLKPKILDVSLLTSPISVIMNVTGDFAGSDDEIRRNLIKQVTHSVRWEQGIRKMMEHGIDGYIEMGCGKTLAGLNKKIGVSQPTLSIEKLSDLDDLLKLDLKYAAVER